MVGTAILRQFVQYSSSRAMSTLKTALIQMSVGVDRDINLQHAAKLIKEAKANGAFLVSLPECFNSPYGVKFFSKYAESSCNGPTTEMLSKAAKDNEIYLIGGSFPEIDGDKYYNTCTIWNPAGRMIGKYRKMHLFDIDVPEGITFKESDVLTAGSKICTFEVNGIKIGVGICYDMRFEELAKVLRLRGCQMIVYPAAFNMTTGPVHWELLQRARALDNQLFICAASPARGDKGYIAWGHSQITNPWGQVLAQAGHEEEILYCDIDFDDCKKYRSQIPIGDQRRTDIYDTICKINV